MRKLASIRKVDEVREIPGADNIEIVQIGGWQCIAQKGELTANSLCLYFEIDSILPDRPCFEFMRPRKFRVRTIKCMKQLSQGLAKPIGLLAEFGINPAKAKEGDDYTDKIGVVKYDPEAEREAKQARTRPTDKTWYRFLERIPIIGRFFRRKSGQGYFPTDIVKKTDEERWQNTSEAMFKDWYNQPIEITEKLDGTSTTFIYKPGRWWKPETFMVCSRNQRLPKDNGSVYWTIALNEKILEKMRLVHKFLKMADNDYLIWQGETLAPNIQGNNYRVSKPEFYLFNFKQFDGKRELQRSHADTTDIINLTSIALRQVPLISTQKVEDYKTLADMIKARPWGLKSHLNPKVNAEGVVIRLKNQNQNCFRSMKFVNPEWLLKHEG
jgi:hypothetical protein